MLPPLPRRAGSEPVPGGGDPQPQDGAVGVGEVGDHLVDLEDLTVVEPGGAQGVEVFAPDGVPVFVDGQMVGKGPRVVVPMRKPGKHEVFAVVDGAMRKVQVSVKKDGVTVDLRKAR